MDAMTAAMQQLASQSAMQQNMHGVVGSLNKAQDMSASQNEAAQNFEAMLQSLKGGTAQRTAAQLLLKKGEENAQGLAAQMLMQNPALLQMLAQAGIDMQQAQQLITSALTNGEINADVQQAQNARNTLLSIAQKALSQTSEMNEQTAKEFVNAIRVLQNPSAPKAVDVQSAAVLETQNELNAQIQKESPKPQPTSLYEKANAENAAQKARMANIGQSDVQQLANAKIAAIKPEMKASVAGEEAQQAEQQITQAKPRKEGEGQISEEAAAQAKATGFENRLEHAQQAQKPEAKDAQELDAKDITRQTLDGLKSGVKSGKDEFVMRLKPEGLGEITVKLENINGKMTMQLSAENRQVQKMLNAELEVLKQAVKPYNVEVREVTNSSGSGLEMSLSSQNSGGQELYSQMHNRFAFYEGKGGQGGTYENSFGTEHEISEFADEPEQKAKINSSALDTYI